MGQDEPGLKDSLLPYEAWIQESLRGVLRFALDRAAAEGLPGDHHFYITFRTDAPGVGMPDRLRAQYPSEMTIVLQHQFDNLRTTPESFSVTLYFGGVPATLSIPWLAVTQFADPTVRFGLRFDAPEQARRPGLPALATEPELPPAEPAATAEATEAASPQVVSLDSFRKRPPGKA